MKTEIAVALDLLASYAQRFGSINEESLEKFRVKLQEILLERYQGHWYPGTGDPSPSSLSTLFVQSF